MFKDFHRRLQRDVKKIVDARVLASDSRLDGEVKVSILGFIPLCSLECNITLVINDIKRLTGFVLPPQSQPVEVNVVSHPIQRYAVWFGGSVLASTPEFFAV